MIKWSFKLKLSSIGYEQTEIKKFLFYIGYYAL